MILEMFGVIPSWATPYIRQPVVTSTIQIPIRRLEEREPFDEERTDLTADLMLDIYN
jgi:hypothetical protein